MQNKQNIKPKTGNRAKPMLCDGALNKKLCYQN
jgi:hypothetical protein